MYGEQRSGGNSLPAGTYVVEQAQDGLLALAAGSLMQACFPAARLRLSRGQQDRLCQREKTSLFVPFLLTSVEKRLSSFHDQRFVPGMRSGRTSRAGRGEKEQYQEQKIVRCRMAPHPERTRPFTTIVVTEVCRG
jgi:hypothetical protein